MYFHYFSPQASSSFRTLLDCVCEVWTCHVPREFCQECEIVGFFVLHNNLV